MYKCIYMHFVGMCAGVPSGNTCSNLLLAVPEDMVQIQQFLIAEVGRDPHTQPLA